MSNNFTKTSIEFFNGISENVIPEIRLTRSKDGSTGQAIFSFNNPDALTKQDFTQIQKMSLIDKEGVIITREVSVTVSNGKRIGIEAIYIWKTQDSFNRFMRFAQEYAKDHGLSYSQ